MPYRVLRTRFSFEHLNDWSGEETGDPLYADDRNFYKVSNGRADGMAVERLLYAGNSLAKAEDISARAIKHRPRIRLTIRQHTRVLQQFRDRDEVMPEMPANGARAGWLDLLLVRPGRE